MIEKKQCLTDTYLYREIYQQPEVLHKLLKDETNHIQEICEQIRKRKVDHVVIAARGTSDNAARYAQYLFGAKNRLSVGLATPSLFTIYNSPPRMDNALVLGISQSGSSPDIVEVLVEARDQGALTIALTNHPRSDLGEAAAFTIDIKAGKEHSIAATKTYTSELVGLAMLSAYLLEDEEMVNAINHLPMWMDETLKIADEINQITERYRYMRDCVVIGRGYNYATAFEFALKLKELTYTLVAPYSSADFLHGPLAMLDTGFPVFVIAPAGMMFPEMRNFIDTLNEHRAEVIVLSDDDRLLRKSRIPLRLPITVPEWLSPVTSIVPGQMFAMFLAHYRNIDVDRPRSLHKVTRTT